MGIIVTIHPTLSVDAKPEAVALSIGFGVLAVLCSLPGGIIWLMRPSLRKAVNAEALKAAG